MAFLVLGCSTDWFKELLDRVSTVTKLYKIVSYLLRWLPEEKTTGSGSKTGNIALMERSRMLCIKLVQMEADEDLRLSSNNDHGDTILSLQMTCTIR